MMADTIEQDLFDSSLVFIEDGTDQDTIFKQVSDKLVALEIGRAHV